MTRLRWDDLFHSLTFKFESSHFELCRSRPGGTPFHSPLPLFPTTWYLYSVPALARPACHVPPAQSISHLTPTTHRPLPAYSPALSTPSPSLVTVLCSYHNLLGSAFAISDFLYFFSFPLYYLGFRWLCPSVSPRSSSSTCHRLCTCVPSFEVPFLFYKVW